MISDFHFEKLNNSWDFFTNAIHASHLSSTGENSPLFTFLRHNIKRRGIAQRQQEWSVRQVFALAPPIWNFKTKGRLHAGVF